MSLPSTRNKTFSAATELDSATMNDLQDMVIGGRHGPLEEYFPFDVCDTSGGDLTDFVAGAPQQTGTGTMVGFAYLRLPVGCTITDVYVHCDASGADYDIDAWFYEIALPDSTLTTIGSISGETIPDGVPTTDAVFSGTKVFLTSKLYVVKVEKQTSSSTTARFNGASVNFSK